jgi:hypothetical protein
MNTLTIPFCRLRDERNILCFCNYRSKETQAARIETRTIGSCNFLPLSSALLMLNCNGMPVRLRLVVNATFSTCAAKGVACIQEAKELDQYLTYKVGSTIIIRDSLVP